MTTYEQRINSKAEEFARAMRFHFNTMEQAIDAMRPLAILAVAGEKIEVKEAMVLGWLNGDKNSPQMDKFITDYLQQNGYLPTDKTEENDA